MPCICGSDLVVVARFRAAAVPRLSCGRCPFTSASDEAGLGQSHTTHHHSFAGQFRPVRAGVIPPVGEPAQSDPSCVCAQAKAAQAWLIDLASIGR